MIFRILPVLALISTSLTAETRHRARDLGIRPGVLSPGAWNAITDVQGVRVGQVTLHRGEDIRTGVTAVVPHSGNVFLSKVPAAVYVANGYGKLMGFTQIEELGNLETPILLTGTLNVSRVADALLDYMLELPGLEKVRSMNPVVGETNDGLLSAIQMRPVGKAEVSEAIRSASSGPVQEGSVGAGTGTVCYGFKGGIGTSSRVLPPVLGGYTIGVLVQTNFGGILQIAGTPVGKTLGGYYLSSLLQEQESPRDGSCMIIVATDAPLGSRNLKRLAKRAMLGLAVTGGTSSNGSGDYVIAFSTAEELRVPHHQSGSSIDERLLTGRRLSNDDMSPLFQAVKESTEEAIYNSLFMATSVTGQNGVRVDAIPLDKVLQILKDYSAVAQDWVIPGS